MNQTSKEFKIGDKVDVFEMQYDNEGGTNQICLGSGEITAIYSQGLQPHYWVEGPTVNYGFIRERISEPIKLPINEIYPCIQGEGKLVGVPSLLIRFTGCRLRCAFASSICDTFHNSWAPEKGSFSLGDLHTKIAEHSHIRHAIVTGGGPTLNPKALKQVCDALRAAGIHITLETEGSEFVEDVIPDLLSLSPKLSSSTPVAGKVYQFVDREITQKEIERHEFYRTNYEAMRRWIGVSKDIQIKPVICAETFEKDIEEVECLRFVLSGDLNKGLSTDNFWLMPEGQTQEILQRTRQRLVEHCIANGFNYTDRLHVVIYGPKRYV